MNPAASKAPFHADHVGSLVRPEWLIAGRKEWLAGRISREELGALEDRAVSEVAAMQKDVGLSVATDGEFRRTNYLTEFLNPIGVELLQAASEDLVYRDDEGHTVPATKAVVRRKIRWSESPNLAAFTYLKSVTPLAPKVTLPAPTQVHLFAGTTGIDKSVYPDIEMFWSDVIAAYAAELRALGEAGCNYVQIDETCIPKLADPVIQEAVKRRGEDWKKLTLRYAEVINAIVAAAPPQMHIALHHCRGNNQGLWQAQAGYDAVAEIMFGTINATSYLLEYDTPRAGDFKPLRYVPKKKFAALGLVSTKSSAIESADELRRRIDDAARFLPIEQLGIAPQCGFSCGFAGSPITYSVQYEKLNLLTSVARTVWGTA